MVEILTGAIIFAIWASILFIGKNIGLSMLLFVVPFTCFLIHLLKKENKIKNKRAKWLFIPITLLSSTYLIFNNSFFNILNIFAIPIFIIFMIWEMFDEDLKLNIGLIAKLIDALITPFSMFGEGFEKAKQALEERFKIKGKKGNKSRKVVKSVLITIPVVIVILLLLSSADATFGNFFSQILNSVQTGIAKIQIPLILVKIIFAGIAFIYLLGAFYYVSKVYEKEDEVDEKTSKDSFTIKMILGSLNVIYFIFCIIQIKSFFIQDASINYAQYARQGFFQLLVVSLINIVVILYAKRIDKKSKYINFMCLAMILFTYIILGVSAYRMYIYEKEYGYTLLRLLVYSGLITEGLMLVPTSFYILNKRVNLTKSYFGIFVVVYLCMNFANFDNIIAKRNVEKFFETGRIDLIYSVESLGTDAINEKIRLLESDKLKDISKSSNKILIRAMNESLYYEEVDFRNFNISKMQAKKIIEEKFGGVITQEEADTNNIVASQKTTRTENINNPNITITNNETIYGVVKSKTENQLEISYEKDAWETLGKVNYTGNTIRNKQDINVGDWVEVSGVVSNDGAIKTYDANVITVTTQKNYQKKLNDILIGKSKIDTEIVFNYESEGGGDGYVFCKLFSEDSLGNVSGYIRINYDQKTEMYLGMARHLRSNYGIQEHELVDVTFTKPVTDVNNITAKMFEFIAD